MISSPSLIQLRQSFAEIRLKEITQYPKTQFELSDLKHLLRFRHHPLDPSVTTVRDTNSLHQSKANSTLSNLSGVKRRLQQGSLSLNLVAGDSSVPNEVFFTMHHQFSRYLIKYPNGVEIRTILTLTWFYPRSRYISVRIYAGPPRSDIYSDFVTTLWIP